jgi:hypothetical protein
MHNYVYGTDFTLTLNRFEYHLEDMDCYLCQYWRGKNSNWQPRLNRKMSWKKKKRGSRF